MIIKHIFSSVIFLAMLTSCQVSDDIQSNQSIKKYDFKINIENISVSGISSGGYMATQFHVAHSAHVSGAAIIAAGPYWCARGSISRALGYCMKGGSGTDPALISDYIDKSQQEKSIDNTSNLKGDNVWIFHGAKDIVMANSVSRAIKDFYSQYTNNIQEVYDIPVNHGMPTLKTGGECDAIGASFLNSCNYDAAGEILKALYGKLKTRTKAVGTFINIDQTNYKQAQFMDSGYLYVPIECKNNQVCKLHTVFHGCMQSSEFVDDTFVKGAGYNEWAESNNIVIFYPQVKSSQFTPMNPKGCWDWWGYTDENYANKKGAQIKAIKALINKITGEQK